MKFTSVLLQGICYAAILSVIAYCSNRPLYQSIPAGYAVIKLSIKHSGQLLGECRERTAEELAGLPANMRAPKVCPRERSPLLVELQLNDDVLYKEQVLPSGLSHDGMASLYKRFSIPGGHYRIAVGMKDHLQLDHFNYQHQAEITLAAEQILVIDFKPGSGGFELL